MPEDGLWLLSIFKHRAFVPTMARTTAGFYMGIEPFEVVDAADHARVEEALINAIRRGNPSVPTPSRSNYPPDPLLKYAKVKSIAAFDKLAKSWKISKRDGAYLIVPYRPRKDSGSEEDVERGEAIPVEVPLEEVVHRLVRRALESDVL